MFFDLDVENRLERLENLSKKLNRDSEDLWYLILVEESMKEIWDNENDERWNKY